LELTSAGQPRFSKAPVFNRSLFSNKGRLSSCQFFFLTWGTILKFFFGGIWVTLGLIGSWPFYYHSVFKAFQNVFPKSCQVAPPEEASQILSWAGIYFPLKGCGGYIRFLKIFCPLFVPTIHRVF